MERRHQGFSLIELMVVIGIIAIVTGLLLPAMMSARRSARTAVCLANLNQVGTLYHIYASANHGLIPVGTSQLPDDPPDYHTANNDYLWVNGAPSAAAGPLFCTRLIAPDNAKILFCPLEKIDARSGEVNLPLFDRALNGERVNIQISYAVRPIRRIWVHAADGTVTYPWPMFKLVDLKNNALMAEHPQLRPYNHGSSRSSFVNVLYADASVRPAGYKQIEPLYDEYINRAAPDHPGYPQASNLMAINEDDPTQATMWHLFDTN